jgi:hypothetical protein
MALADVAQLEVRTTKYGNVNAGPDRWARAHKNAVKRPNSRGAKLYAWRLAVAAEVAGTAGVKDEPYVLVHNHRVDHGLPVTKEARREYACSSACVTMLMQLTADDKKTVEEYVDILVTAGAGAHGHLIGQVFWGGVMVDSLDRSLDRGYSCRVCAQPIVSDRQVVREIEKTTADRVTYVLLDGRLVPVANLRVVDLTDEQHRLLSQYAEVDGRERYVADHGRRLDA